MVSLSLHEVEKIEVCNHFVSNMGCRRLRITNKDGVAVELTLFGNTAALDALPFSADFKDYDADAKALAEPEAA